MSVFQFVASLLVVGGCLSANSNNTCTLCETQFYTSVSSGVRLGSATLTNCFGGNCQTHLLFDNTEPMISLD